VTLIINIIIDIIINIIIDIIIDIIHCILRSLLFLRQNFSVFPSTYSNILQYFTAQLMPFLR